MTEFPFETRVIENTYGRVVVAVRGAQVLSFTPKVAGVWGKEVFFAVPPEFLAEAYAKNLPLRGGVPVCERFGPNPDGIPQHGLCRNTDFRVTQYNPERAVTLAYKTDGNWPGFPANVEFMLLIVLDAKGLMIRFVTHNLSGTTLRLRQALHPYFAVSNVNNVLITGMSGAKVTSSPASAGSLSYPTLGEEEVLMGEVDAQVALTSLSCAILDSVWRRILRMRFERVKEATLWTPGSDKGKAELVGRHDTFVCLEPCYFVEPLVILPDQLMGFEMTVWAEAM